jgi:glycyl-tRNA synthetase beta chain
MTDFLLELRSEEIPARMQGKAKEDLARLFGEAIARAGLRAESVETFATPRRLALIARGLPDATEAVSEETKGPKVGAPPQALEGFTRKVGLTVEQLTERDGVWFAVVEKPGRATRDVLAEAIPQIVRTFPWPKSMRWGAASASTESLRWVRPLQGIVAILGEDVVPCEVDGVLSGYQTLGHRFHHPGPITIGGAHDYVEKLRACHVIVHFSERCAIIRDGARAVAEAAGLVLVEDEGLVAENAGLTEWPVPMLGRFDPAFLAVPEEVIQLTARVNQKYFVCRYPPRLRGGVSEADGGGAGPASEALGIGAGGEPPPPASPVPLPVNGEDLNSLANAFVCTANIDASDGGEAIVAGNEKVLAARLSDAKFFWEQDLNVPLERQAEKLSQIVFHEKLGTVADKVERVAKLARWLCEEGIVKSSPERGGGPAKLVEGQAPEEAPPSERTPDVPLHHPADGPPLPLGEDLADLAERAARLCKADLVTGMVGEFPELQGVMGGHIARAQGEPDAVADAIRDHYRPVGQGDDVPTAPVTVAVSLADKLDTLIVFFAIGEFPTGSRDPFAIRRTALSVVRILTTLGIRLSTKRLKDALRREIKYQAVGKLIEIAVDTGLIKGRRARAIQLYDSRKYAELLWQRQKFDSFELELLNFIADRLKVQQREAGVRHDLIDAVFALGGEDDLVRLLARVKALQAFVGTEEGADLLAGYKRAANILKSSPEGGGGPAKLVEGQAPEKAPMSEQDTDVPLHHAPHGPPLRSGEDVDGIPQTGAEDPFVEVDQGMRRAIAGNEGRTEGTVPEGAAAADIALLGALDIAEPQARAAVAEERFEGAMAALASLRAPIDRFFDEVMVNDEDAAKRAFRLGLLARFRDAVHQVADFSKIEG